MSPGQQRDDAVGLTQLLGAQHDRLVTVEAHAPIVLADPAGGQAPTAARRPASAPADAGVGVLTSTARRTRPPRRRGGPDASATPGCCGPRRTALRHLVGEHRGVGGRVDRVARVADHQRGRLDRARGACWTARCARRRCRGSRRPSGPGRWSRVSSAIAGPERHEPARDQPGQPARHRDRQRHEPGERTSAGRRRSARPPARCRAPASPGAARAPGPARRRRPRARRWRRARYPRRRPASAPRWSSSATTCSPKAVIE